MEENQETEPEARFMARISLPVGLDEFIAMTRALDRLAKSRGEIAYIKSNGDHYIVESVKKE
jgi:hypothetical protein